MAEMNGNYVNEQAHQKGKAFFKKAALIAGLIALAFLIVGIILIVVGANKKVPNMLEEGWFEADSSRTGTIFGGIALIAFALIPGGVAISMLVTAHKRDILAYEASSVAPVVGETVNYIADETSPAIQKVVGAVSTGVAEGVVKAKTALAGNSNTNQNAGQNAGQNAQSEGQTASAVKYCQECGTKNPRRAKFCSNCGRKFE